MHNSIIVSMDSYQQTKYDDDICNAISFPDGTGNSTRFCFKKAFGGCDPTAERAIGLSSMNPDKLDKAPIHILAAERSVWFVNYELFEEDLSS